MTNCALKKNVFTMMIFFKYNQLKSDEDQRIILTMLMSPTQEYPALIYKKKTR